MIQIHQLIKTFGEKTAVNIPELTIADGVILGIVGNNGAGKSTLFRLMLDLLKADSGHVLLHDIDPSLQESWKESTGAYLDEGFLIDFLTPEEYFEFIASANSLSKELLYSRLEGFSQFMNGEIMNQKKLIRDFSAGNKQKIGIIGAMLNMPSLLILDEPFNFLDPSSQHTLKKILADYHSSTGATILISSHNLQHTIDLSTHIVLLEHGSVIKDLSNAGRQAEPELEAYFSN
ncbi:MAG: ABC transporter ATP-binding protein [Prevotella sp.]|nr:ABC transporter ATP-binding protein [Prevotella sp.]